MELKIGVLALQGGFAKHCAQLQRLNVATFEVRYPQQLQHCDALILPGGESTTIYTHLNNQGFIEPLLTFSQEHPLFGTCAGCIVMARLNILNLTIKRNAYGKQIDSFTTQLLFQGKQIPAPFIRAPLITSIGNNVNVLAQYQQSAVLVQQGFHMAATFHPELTNDVAVHTYFCHTVVKETVSSSSLKR